MKEWTPKGTLAQKLNVLISCCDGLLLLLESSRRVSEEERSRSVLLKKTCEEENERVFAQPFILSREVTQAEWYKSLLLDEIYKFDTLKAKTITALNNNLKSFLSATGESYRPPAWGEGLTWSLHRYKTWRCPWCNGYRCRKWTQVQILDKADCISHMGK